MKRLLLVLTLAVFTIFTGCSSDLEASDVLPLNENGFSLEHFADEASSIIFTYSTLEEELTDSALELFSRLTVEEDSFDDFMLKTLFTEFSLEFTDEFATLIGDQYRLMLSAYFDFDASSSPSTIELYDTTSRDSMIVVLQLEDTENALEVLNDLNDSNSEFIKTDTNGFYTLSNTVNGTQIVFIDTFLLFAKSEQDAFDAVSRYSGELISIADSNDYLEAVDYLSDDVFSYVYLDMSGEVDATSFTQIGIAGEVDFHQIYGVSADDDGFEISGVTRFDEAQLKEAEVDFTDFASDDLYMYEMVEDSAHIFYSEGFNLARGLRMSGGEDASLEQNFRAFFGTSIEDGLYSFLDQGYYVSLKRGSYIIPQLSLVADSSSNVTAARDLYLKIDSQLTGLITLLQSQQDGLVTKSVADDVSTVEFSLGALPVDPTMFALLPSQISDSKIALMYGVTDETAFITVSDSDGFEPEATDVFEDALDMVSGSDGGVTFVDFNELELYFNSLTAFISAMQQAQSEIITVTDPETGEEIVIETEPFEELNQMKEIASQLDYFVLGNEITSMNEIESTGSLRFR